MAINTTLSTLVTADSNLKDYIISLQEQATELEASIATTNQKIDQMKESLEGEIDANVAAVITQLESVKAEIESELSTINAIIEQLQAKDEELSAAIAELKSYVDVEIKNTEDWVSTTFATLEQYNALSAEVATIKVDSETINAALEELENCLLYTSDAADD